MRYWATAFSVLLFTAVSSYSQQPSTRSSQACPIHVDSWFGGSNRDYPIWLKFMYTNMGAKDIAAWSIKAESVDILGNVSALSPTPVYIVVKHKKPFRAGKKDDEIFDNANPYLPPGAYRMWLYQVRFTDGTTWQDDGSHSCYTDHSF